MHSPDLDSLTFSSDNISKTSCLNTPSTFPSEFPSDLLGGLPEQAPSQKIMSPYSKVKGWVHHTAMNAVGKKNKEQRACYNCFVRKQACEPGIDPTRCGYCKSSQSYCKGHIEAPTFVNVDTLKDTASLALKRIKTVPDCPLSDMGHLVKRTFEHRPIMQRGLPVLLPQPLTEFPHLSELPAADRMLDVLLSFEIAHPQPIRAGVGLAEVEGLCRRFCACMILLRSLDKCTIDTNVLHCHHIYHLVLGFVVRLSLIANDMLKRIFEHIKACCGATRHATRTPNLMGKLASLLGQSLAEVRHLRRHAQRSPIVPLLAIAERISLTESGLTYYGKTFDNDKFVKSSLLGPRVLPGIHLQTSGPSFPVVQTILNVPSKAWPSVFGILSLELSTNDLRNHIIHVSEVEAPASPEQLCDNTSVLDSTEVYRYSSQAVDHGALTPQATIKQGFGPNVINDEIVQLESDKAQIQMKIDMLQRLALHEGEEIRALEGPVALDNRVSEQCFDGQYGRGESPEQGNSETDILVQPEASFRSTVDVFCSLDLAEARTRIEDTSLQPFLYERDEDMNMGVSAEVHESTQDRKRKRISSPATSTKQEDSIQLENGTVTATDINNESTDMAEARMSCSKSRKRSSTILQLAQRPSGTHCDHSQLQSMETVSTVENSDPKEIDDINLQAFPHYEHRPKTWPLRQMLRKSVDISVKTLVKGLDRLRV